MNVLALTPRGYCYGVINAINTAKQARIEHPDKDIYILGMIVHNKYIVEALEKLNIKTLDDKQTSRNNLIDEINKGVVILSAHGSAQAVKEKALEKGLIVYDATCKDVLKTLDLIKDYLAQDYEILYYGKQDHPEAIAALSLDPKHIHLIRNKDDLNNYLHLKDKNIFITNQTTISILDANIIFEQAALLFENITIAQEICNATRVRQNAVLKMADDIELVFVVGDHESNNSNKLYKLAKINPKFKVHMIESLDDIEIEWLKGIEKVAITSGASTPTYLTNMIINYLKQFDYENKATYVKEKVDINKILE